MTKRSIIYTRRATRSPVEHVPNSLEEQRLVCERYMQRQQGWQVVTTRYDDDGYSGMTWERPALQRLLHEVTAGEIDAVVVHRLDRLSRSYRDVLRCVVGFKQHHVKILCATQAIDDILSLASDRDHPAFWGVLS